MGLVKRALPALFLFGKKMKSTIVTKSEMQTIFNKDGQAFAATGLNARPCVVLGFLDKEKNGYEAVLLKFGDEKKNTPKLLKEVLFDQEPKLEIGQELKAVEIFKEGDLVSITGVSKGKGFAGVVKRWHFKGGPRTHGQSDRERAPGSSGPTTTPGRVLKGSRRPGRMGSEKKTVKNLEILKIDPENNFLWVKGAVPGRKGGFLVINKI